MSQPIIVKAKYEKEIRILPVYTDELSFDELYLMVSRMFKGHIATDDDLILKYVDSDGDLITLGDAADLDLALLENKKLCLHVSNRPQEGIEHSLIDEPFKAEKNSITSIEGIVLVDELATVRSQLNNLIDRLSSFRPVNTISTKYKDVGIQETEKFATFPDSPATAVLPPSSKTQTPPPSQTSLFASNPALDYTTQIQQPTPLPPSFSYAAPGPFHPATQPSFQPTYYASQSQQQFSHQYGGAYMQGAQTSSSFPPSSPCTPSTWMTGNPSLQYQMQSAPMAPPPPPPPPMQSGFPGQQQSAQHHSGSYPRQRGYQ